MHNELNLYTLTLKYINYLTSERASENTIENASSTIEGFKMDSQHFSRELQHVKK